MEAPSEGPPPESALEAPLGSVARAASSALQRKCSKKPAGGPRGPLWTPRLTGRPSVFYNVAQHVFSAAT